MKRSLLIGCGNSREKKVFTYGSQEWVGELTTIDMNPNCGAHWNLDLSMYFGQGNYANKLPFDDESFDELAAYDSLEHWGQQGNWRQWFNEMAEYHRILKPGGEFGIIVPIGGDMFADPGHTRFFGANHFRMLSQQFYADALAQGLQITDYRWFWKHDFETAFMENMGGHHLAVILRKSA